MGSKRDAFKESLADVGLGIIINVPINYAIIEVAFAYSWTAAFTATFMTLLFTVLAIARKMYVRLHFGRG